MVGVRMPDEEKTSKFIVVVPTTQPHPSGPCHKIAGYSSSYETAATFIWKCLGR